MADRLGVPELRVLGEPHFELLVVAPVAAGAEGGGEGLVESSYGDFRGEGTDSSMAATSCITSRGMV